MDKIKEYFKTKAISNSLLGTLWNPRWIRIKMENPDMEDDDRKYFRIGSALDCILTSPERWEQDFKVIEATRPYGFMGKFIDNLPENLSIISPVEMYQEAYDKAGYKMSIHNVISKFWADTNNTEYYLLTRGINEDVTIVSKDEMESVNKAKELIMANKYISKYFFISSPWDEIMKQVPIYFTYKEQKCKALLDGILIDHKNKIIMPYDLKTTGKSVYDFSISYTQFGYHRQCAFYELALLSEESPIKNLLEEGYTLDNFRFIVVETKVSSSHPAIVYKTSSKDRKCGIEGGYIGKKYYKGIDELIDDYVYHMSTNNWELPVNLIKSEGEIQLDIFDYAEESSYNSPDSEY